MAIFWHCGPATSSAFSFSGTRSVFWPSYERDLVPSRSSVPVGKLDVTTGPSHLEGPASSDLTVWVVGSIRESGSLRWRM